MATKVDTVESAQAALARKKGEVKVMKKTLAPDSAEMKKAIRELKELQKALTVLIKGSGLSNGLDSCNRKDLDKLLGRRMFVVPSFDIYGGVKGLYDFGPPACALKANVIQTWRNHFILEENMLELDCTNLTPFKVLETSGHVAKFSDLMVKDQATGECLRADHLLEKKIDKELEDIEMPAAQRAELEHVRAQADAYSPEELHEQMLKLKIVGSDGKPFDCPFPFNLMFGTQIGPEGGRKGFLRPETAQGMFVNFKKCLEYNGGKMPFAAAQVGIGFRNEISPRAGLLRAREFPMAEIEHFVNPDQKDHPKFRRVKDLCLPLFPEVNQLGDGKTVKCLPLGKAVATGVVNNETLAYFMARTYQFLVKVGVKSTHIRFRQHLKTEMAHYASDCWDAEIYLSYGWVECVGIADRSCFDLTMHAKASKVDMRAEQRYKEKQIIDVVTKKYNKKLLGKTFKRDQKAVKETLEEMDVDASKALDAKLEADGKAMISTCAGEFEVTREMVPSIKFSKKGVDVLKFLPGVIEPAFGIGRILYAIMEHSFSTRPEDRKKAVMAFLPQVAPVKCSVFALSHNDTKMDELTQDIVSGLASRGISNKSDASGVSIGKRYTRTDEIGVPFAITVDFDSFNPEHANNGTVTVRERDTRKQIRVPVDAVCDLIKDLAEARVTWDKALELHTIVA